jgi:hypothetical protein
MCYSGEKFLYFMDVTNIVTGMIGSEKNQPRGLKKNSEKNQANVVGREDSKLQYRPSWGHYATVQRREALCASSAAVG